MSGAATADATPSLASLQGDFERAARASGGAVDLRLKIARCLVCVRFAGSAAAEALSLAFAHLISPERKAPVLTLHVWDSATASIERPAFAPARRADAHAASGAGASYFYDGPGFRALHQPATDALSVLNDAADAGWFWAPDATKLPYWDYTAPFRHLLSWWLAAQGLRHVHGGAVGTTDAGLLLVGPGGSGKSTTALAALLDERFRYAGDDYVAVSSEPTIHSLYCAAKVHPDDVHRLPHLEPALAVGDGADKKAVVHVETAFPGRTIADFPLRAIVVPSVTERPTARARPGTQAVALAALAPSTIFQLHPPARDALMQLAGLVRQAPTFVLELGSDIDTIPDALTQILEQAG